MNATAAKEAIDLAHEWAETTRWSGIERDYTAEDVVRLRGSVRIEHTLARRGAEKLWRLLHQEDYVAALGALTGGQAVQMVKAGLKAIYLSGWQVAADGEPRRAGLSRPEPLPGEQRARDGEAPQQRAPARRPDRLGGGLRRHRLARADRRRRGGGFGGPLNAFELMKGMIEAGAAAVHFEDQLASEKKCGHMGGKVLVPTGQFVRTLLAARLAADVMGVPTLVVARTDADAATLLTSDVDERDRPFLTGERTPEGFFCVRAGIEAAIARGLAYAPYADLVWMETSTPDLGEAREFAEAIHDRVPGQAARVQLLAVVQLEAPPGRRHDRRLPAGARCHGLQVPVHHARRLPRAQRVHVRAGARLRGRRDVRLRASCSSASSRSRRSGYTATRHQREVGAGYFDQVAQAISGGQSSTLALKGSTEEAQFETNGAA